MEEEVLNNTFDEKEDFIKLEELLQYNSIRNGYIKLVLKAYSIIMSKKYSDKSFKMLNNRIYVSPVDSIDAFGNILDFFLSLLEHEKILAKHVYTRYDLAYDKYKVKLFSLVIYEIEHEFEQYFVHDHDYSKIGNNGTRVVTGIINLVLKVQSLQEKVYSKEIDISTALKIMGFSLRLNEMSAVILSTYLEAVKAGYLDKTSQASNDCQIHEHCRITIDTCRLINRNRNVLIDSLRIACNSIQTASMKKINHVFERMKMLVS